MKKITFLLSLALLCMNSYAQIEQVVELRDGKKYFAELIEVNDNSIEYSFPSGGKKKKVINQPFDDIVSLNTLGVRFLLDQYDNYLSGNRLVMEWDRFAHYNDLDVFVSFRKINDSIVLMIKIKYDKSQGSEYKYKFLKDDEIVKLTLKNGDIINIPLQNQFRQLGYVIYDFGYYLPTNDEVDKLLMNPIDDCTFLGLTDRVNDAYVFMRQLFAIYGDQHIPKGSK